MEVKGSDSQAPRKRVRVQEDDVALEAIVELGGSQEETELHISNILHKIDAFTNLVSELLESGKAMFKELSNEFEERTIAVHKEQVEKWHDEINQLKSLRASNHEADALLNNARLLLQTARTNF